MAPYTGDERIHGLHYLAVMRAANKLVAACAQAGGATLVAASVPQVLTELEELEEAVNRLSKFAAEAGARGTLRVTDADTVTRILAAAETILNTTASDRDAARMTQDQVDSLFDLHDESPQAPEQPAGDPFEL
jgi:protein involved in polysaccharide export with SLBB domain